MENLVIASDILKSIKPNLAVIYSLLSIQPKNDDGTVMLPIIEITALVRLSKAEVTAALAKLEDAGWLIASPRQGWVRTNRYTLRGPV